MRNKELNDLYVQITLSGKDSDGLDVLGLWLSWKGRSYVYIILMNKISKNIHLEE